jgi:hypothetical protein
MPEDTKGQYTDEHASNQEANINFCSPLFS